mmetsp:Transcript_2839/g.6623  ORF Transcript_2839/g.6623 Transcript_2839/m.6623 type:complete len:109 (-) Transcript_2839:238-564(-)
MQKRCFLYYPYSILKPWFGLRTDLTFSYVDLPLLFPLVIFVQQHEAARDVSGRRSLLAVGDSCMKLELRFMILDKCLLLKWCFVLSCPVLLILSNVSLNRGRTHLFFK